MKTQAKHTPTPWKVSNNGHKKPYLIVGEDKYQIANVSFSDERELSEKEANATFIVKAVNSHQELIQALRLAIVYVDKTLPTYKFIENALKQAEET